MPKFIHLFSGGLDSTTLLYDLLDQGYNVECMTFDYGQTHRREINAAKGFCKDLDIKQHLVELPKIYSRCALVGGKRLGVGDSPTAIVPNRNMILISIAAAYGLEHGATAVSWAANVDDEKLFPDCRYQDYLKPLNTALRACHTRRIEVHAPYLMGQYSKAWIVGRARELGVPIEKTWSCYVGAPEPCGECGACELRNAAILEAIPTTQPKQ